MPDPGVRAYGSHLNAWKGVGLGVIRDFRYMLFRPGRASLYTVEPEEEASSRGNSSSNSVY